MSNVASFIWGYLSIIASTSFLFSAIASKHSFIRYAGAFGSLFRARLRTSVTGKKIAPIGAFIILAKMILALPIIMPNVDCLCSLFIDY